MLTPLLLILLSAPPAEAAAPRPRVAVLDVSASDAIYEDVSRALADGVVAALEAQGLNAVRVDERDVPEGCRFGPCLAKVAQAQAADALVAMDALELEGGENSGVALTAMAGNTGEPLAGGRYVVTPEAKKPPKDLARFAKSLAGALAKRLAAASAARAAAKPPGAAPR